MNKHYCVGVILKHGQHWWGHPEDGPLSEPIPQELLEMHPDVLLDWSLCENCGTPICGQLAPFKFVVSDMDDTNRVTVYLCAKHYDEMVESQFPTWHECRC
ncbi:MAG: hypothetical protein WBE55_00065 [Candidatus Sulfotelmatobacter sp.]